MVIMTSAYANKMLKKLTEDKEYWLRKKMKVVHILRQQMRNL